MSGTTPIDYQLLAAFVAVAEQASFTKAARKLGTGKSSISRAVSRLEAIIGAELLHRSPRHVALSTAGTALYERTASHLAALDQALVRAPERSEEPSGELRITAPHDFGATILPAIMAQFSRRYPGVCFDVRLTNAQVDIVAEGFDLAIRASPRKLNDSTLTVRRLLGGITEFYAAPAYVARRGRPRRVAEANHDWILHPAAVRLWKLTRDKVRFVVDDFFMIRELLREGAGVGVLPPFLAQPYVGDGLLERLTIADRSGMPGSLVLLYSSRGQVARKVTAFRDFLLERIAKAPSG